MLPRMTDADSSMRWLYDAAPSSRGLAVRGTPRTMNDSPDATVVADSAVGGNRHLTVRFRAPRGTLSYVVSGAAFMRAIAIDGRRIETTRYRRVPGGLSVPFTAPPDSGFTVVLELPRDSSAKLQLKAMSPGLPVIPGINIPARPTDVVAVQNGDVTVRYRRVRLP